jgi:hypothetical protein
MSPVRPVNLLSAASGEDRCGKIPRLASSHSCGLFQLPTPQPDSDIERAYYGRFASVVARVYLSSDPHIRLTEGWPDGVLYLGVC